MVDLYERVGAIDVDSYPTFFAQMTYNNEIVSIYEQFGFRGAPNLVVSKPHMAVVSEIEKKIYLQGFKWSISHTDGHVTTHKMLEFVNKRTGKDVFYKPPLLTMLQMFFGFIAVALVGVYAYTRLRFLWNHWAFWLVGSLVLFSSYSSFTSLVVRASSMTSSTMSPSPAATPKLEKPSSFPAETGSNMALKAGSYLFQSLWLDCSLSW
jgi:hypothetical protein